MRGEPDLLDLELAALGLPDEATPLASPSELLARAGVAAPIAFTLGGWRLAGALGLAAAAGIAIGTVASRAPDPIAVPVPVVVTAVVPATAPIATDPIPADPHGATAIAAAPRPALAPRARATRPESPLACPDPSATPNAPGPAALDALDAVLARALHDDPAPQPALPDDDPAAIPPLDALIGPVDAVAAVARPEPAREPRDRELWAHLGLGPRRVIGPGVGGAAAQVGATFHPRTRGPFGPSAGVEGELGWLGGLDRGSAGAARADVAYGWRGDLATVRAGWSAGARWHLRGADVPRGPAFPDPADPLPTGVAPVTGPVASVSVGGRDRGAVIATGGLDLVAAAAPFTDPVAWFGIGIDIPIGHRPDRYPPRVERAEAAGSAARGG